VPYPIFPSISRAPVYEQARTIEDGTLSSPAESGYVSTRPRFTRLRRTWKCVYRNLVLSDLILLDQFVLDMVKGGANAFYLPNMLQNGSFETLGTGSETFDGWTNGIGAENEAAIVVGSGASGTYGPVTFDGSRSLGIKSVNGTTVTNATPSGAGATVTQYIGSVTPGDVMQFSGKLNIAIRGMQFGVDVITQPFFTFTGATQIYGDAVNASTGFTPGLPFSDYNYSFTVPDGASDMIAGVLTWFISASSSPVVLDGTNTVFWDHCGLALTSVVRPYGRMFGSEPLGCAVRFTKMPDVRDAKPAEGVKRWDVTFEVTEQ
jgi:hypothetical protein